MEDKYDVLLEGHTEGSWHAILVMPLKAPFPNPQENLNEMLDAIAGERWFKHTYENESTIVFPERYGSLRVTMRRNGVRIPRT